MSEPRASSEAALPELSVVLPTRNEAGNIDPLLARLRSALGTVDYELVFLDDSDDETAAMLGREAALDPRIRVIHRMPEFRQGGLSTAVVLGLHEARGSLICVMDADLQHTPETIPAMLAAAAAGAGLGIAIYTIVNTSSQEVLQTNVGWGLIVVLIASIAAFLVALTIGAAP